MKSALRWPIVVVVVTTCGLARSATSASCQSSTPATRTLTVTAQPVRAGRPFAGEPIKYITDVWATGRWGASDTATTGARPGCIAEGPNCPEGLARCNGEDWRRDLGLNSVRIGLDPILIDLAGEWKREQFETRGFQEPAAWSCPGGASIEKMQRLFDRSRYRPGTSANASNFAHIKAATESGHTVLLVVHPGYGRPRPAWFPKEPFDAGDKIILENWVFAIAKFLECRLAAADIIIEVYNEPDTSGYRPHRITAAGNYEDLLESVKRGLDAAGVGFEVAIPAMILTDRPAQTKLEAWLGTLTEHDSWDHLSLHIHGGRGRDCQLESFRKDFIDADPVLKSRSVFQDEWLFRYPGRREYQGSPGKSAELASSILTAAKSSYQMFGLLNLFESQGENEGQADCAGGWCHGLIEVSESAALEYENDFCVRREYYYARMAIRGATSDSDEKIYEVVVSPDSGCATSDLVAVAKRGRSTSAACTFGTTTLTVVNRSASTAHRLRVIGQQVSTATGESAPERLGVVSVRTVRPAGREYRGEMKASPATCAVGVGDRFDHVIPPQAIMQFTWQCVARSCADL